MPDQSKWGSQRYAVAVVRRSGRVAVLDLGEAATIDAAVSELRAVLSDPTRDTARAAQALHRLVMEPVARHLEGVNQLLVSPDGPLALVPFAALVDRRGRWVVDDFDVTYLTSGRDLLRPHSTRENGPALILGAPDYGADETSAPATRRAGLLADARFAPLPGTADEAHAIAPLWPTAVVKLGPDATTAALLGAHGPVVLHLATHGFFLRGDDEVRANTRGMALAETVPEPADLTPPLLRAGLALAGANRRTRDDDGILTALEVSSLDLTGTRVVVLSACESGIGATENGEGVAGLRRALFLAGAETAVTSLWKVDDESTRALMVAYHHRLREGASRSAALRDASLATRAAHPHPFYWAAFVSVGDAGPLPPMASDAGPAGGDLPRVRGGACRCGVPGDASRGDSGWIAVLLGFALSAMRRRTPVRGS